MSARVVLRADRFYPARLAPDGPDRVRLQAANDAACSHLSGPS